MVVPHYPPPAISNYMSLKTKTALGNSSLHVVKLATNFMALKKSVFIPH